MRQRCIWPGDNPLYVEYHDREWGVPVFDDRLLFEFLILEGFQAGLSWLTILKKRENFRKAFAGFDPEKVARFTPGKIELLLQDPGIVRNRQKVEAAVVNAREFLIVQKEHGSFSNYIWGFTGGNPLNNVWRSDGEIPAQTGLAMEISKGLKRRGFKFCGPTIVYAHMQATGMVNDHTVDCFRHREVQRKSNWIR
jgi:DNA-3-methyladenine glycosylase I